MFQGLIKQIPSDFQVIELLDFEFSGDGEHDYLWVEKENTNTTWVARALATHAGVAERDVGYAGLKDRDAVTRQWFSVRRPSGEGTDWTGLNLSGSRILETARHQRKLKRGAHRGNQFRIVVRGVDAPTAMINERLTEIRQSGVPNYFGPQRFGHGGNNIRLAKNLFAGKRMKRAQRSIALSAARSFLFNEMLSARVSRNTWNTLLPGEAVNLDGTGSFFVADSIDDELVDRARSLDIHPTGVLWGKGQLKCVGQSAALALAVAEQHATLATGLEKAGLEMSCRALRLPLREFSWDIADGDLCLDFRLDRGSFATAVIREIAA